MWNWYRNQRQRHQRLIVIAIGWGLVVIIAHTSFFHWLVIPGINKPFAEGFWPNLIAGIGSGLLVAWLIGEALTSAGKYDLQLNFDALHETEYTKTLYFYLVNKGDETFESHGIKWNIFVEVDVISRDELMINQMGGYKGNAERQEQPIIIHERQYRKYHGLIAFPLYAMEPTQLMWIDLKRRGPTTTRVYFYLSTGHGRFPHTMKIQANGDPVPESLDTAEAYFYVSLPVRVKNF